MYRMFFFFFFSTVRGKGNGNSMLALANKQCFRSYFLGDNLPHLLGCYFQFWQSGRRQPKRRCEIFNFYLSILTFYLHMRVLVMDEREESFV